MHKELTVNNPAKPPVYIRLYAEDGGAISELKVSHFGILSQHVRTGFTEILIDIDATEINNLQPLAGDKHVAKVNIESRPGAAIHCISCELTPEAKEKLTVSKEALDRFRVKPAKRWWEFF
jgi:hypothetical protein